MSVPEFPNDNNPLPREIRPGVYWLGQCTTIEHAGRLLHAYNSVFVISGETASMVIEGGAPADLDVIERQLDILLDRGIPPVKYLFPTHSETNHSSGGGRMLARFPEAVVVGDPTDFHLNFPEHEDRLDDRPPGVDLDLGGRAFTWVPGVFFDLPSTRWGIDRQTGMLFAGDGLAFTHYHQAGHCGHTAEESIDTTDGLAVTEMTRMFSEAAFYWSRFVDTEAYITRLRELITEYDIQIIGPTHGLPITDMNTTVRYVEDGMRIGADNHFDE